ncbi:MAG TPA: hypothetical protein PKI69_02075 [Rhodocyclaceae bacterium]|nr:hypothetical protein [Rhodocyclaceae bacterium]
MLVTLLPADAVAWRRDALGDGAWWCLWTGPFSHWSALHLAGNLTAAAALSVLIGPPVWRWIAVLPAVAPLLSLFLIASAPDLQQYRGLSGLLGVLVVGAGVEGGVIGRLVAGLYVVKLAVDAIEGASSPVLPTGVAVVWQAHLGGLLLGLLVAASFHLHRRASASTPTRTPSDTP